MGRKFLPSLRGLTPSQPETEGKSLSIVGSGGPGFSSMTSYGSARGLYGTEGRADSWDMEAAITEGYERVVWAYRCIELVSGHAARLPFGAAKNLGKDNEERLEDHPLYRVLNKRANPLEKAYHLRKRLSAQLLLSKRGVFVEVIKSRAGRIVRLDLLDPQRVRVIPDPDGDYIAHYEYTRRDGVVREIDPSRIRWIREPHPTDPFSGTTPLEAAGMSVELDFLSRFYNTSFIKNDSRPGGVLGVDSESLTDQEMDRLERSFRPGAQHAGELQVIGTGPGGLNYVDTTTKPRDMSYAEMSRNAKVEILGAFGVGESLLGNASERSYENAEAELYNFWTQVMPPHLALIAAAFEEDLDDEWEPFFDVSGVEVLELPRRRDREEARNEFTQGLRTIDEYRALNRLAPLNLPQTRALWVSPSKAPIPGRPEDAAALGLGAGGEMGGDPAAGGMPPEGGPEGGPPAGPEGGETAAAAVEEARVLADGEQEAGDELAPAEGAAAGAVDEARGMDNGAGAPPGAAAAAVDEASADYFGQPGEAADAVEEARRRQMEGKSLEGKALPIEESGPLTFETSDSDAQTLAMAVKAALDALMERQRGVITARLESPKTRKGTKFWTPESAADTRGGDVPLDVEKVVDESRWAVQTVNTVTPLAGATGAAVSGAVLAQLVAAGVVVGGGAGAGAMSATAARVALGPAMAAASLAVDAIEGFLDVVQDRLVTSTLVTSRISDVIEDLHELYAAEVDDLTRNVAQSVAYATVNGSLHATAASLAPAPPLPGVPAGPSPETTQIVAEWVTMGDDRVRPEHRAAAGQRRPLGMPFEVGGLLLRFPGDPLGPPHLVRGCRCHLRYRVDSAARMIAPPA